MKNRKKLVVANWKMNVQTLADAKKLISGVKKKTALVKRTEILFCPSFVHLPDLKTSVSKKTKLGAQNVSHEDSGPYTGEVSAAQVRGCGVSHVILGHSERRRAQNGIVSGSGAGETDEMINKKVLAVLRSHMVPVLCVGELVHDEDGLYLQYVRAQLSKGLAGVSKSDISDVIIAYEPVWAVGKKTAMNPRDIHEMTLYIRKCLRELFGTYADSVQILYGGDVTVQDCFAIVSEGFVDGLLVGRESLEVEDFAEIVRQIDRLK